MTGVNQDRSFQQAVEERFSGLTESEVHALGEAKEAAKKLGHMVGAYVRGLREEGLTHAEARDYADIFADALIAELRIALSGVQAVIETQRPRGDDLDEIGR